MNPILAIILIVVGVVVGVAVGFGVGIAYRKKVAEKEIGSAEAEATRIINDAIKSGESKKREMLVEAKEEIHKSRNEYEKEVKERRADLQKQERRLQQKEESLDKKLDAFEKKEEDLRKRQAAIAAAQGRGVAIMAAVKSGIPVYESTPLQVKQAVAGYGRADKKQQ